MLQAFTTILLFVCFASLAQAKTDIEFLLDLSGSMRKVADGETQIDSARKALLKTVEGIPADTFVAVRAYGHRVAQTDKDASCRDTELLVPFAPLEPAALKARIQSLTPIGYTPIAYSLEEAKGDFAAEREAEKVIILLSDGEETCGGDPVAVLKKLQEAGFKVVVHTVGFNVDAATRQQLQAIAQAGAGKYFDARGAEGLNKALGEATQESLLLEKEKTTYGQAIRGGNSYETAVALPLNVELKLDHHQQQSDYDYFYADLQTAQQLTIELHTLEQGINLQGGQLTENRRPYAGLQLHGGARNELQKINIIGDPHVGKTIEFVAPTADRYYLLVGSVYSAMHKDHVTFKAVSVAKGDLESDKDAGATIQEAMPILVGRYAMNYLGGGDEHDVFRFEAKKDEVYFVGLIPNEELNSYFKLEIFDSYKQRLLLQSSGVNQGLKSQSFAIPADGTYYLDLSFGVGQRSLVAYTLELARVSEAPVAPPVAPGLPPTPPPLAPSQPAGPLPPLPFGFPQSNPSPTAPPAQ